MFCKVFAVLHMLTWAISASLLVAQAPRRWRFVEGLPKNAMGKLNKKELLKDFMETAVAVK